MTVRSDIYDIVSGVANTGRVYDYKRYGRALYEVYLELFKTTVDGLEQIRGFDMMAGPVSSERLTFRSDGVAGILRNHTFYVNGYLRWNDSEETEKTIETLAIAVVDALDDSDTLHDGQTYYNTDPAQITALDGIRQGNILCNHCTIQVNVYTLET